MAPPRFGEMVKAFYRLKNVKRRGWILAGMPESKVESVCEHVSGVVFLSLLYSKFDHSVNGETLIKMALIHDLAESVIGDLTPHDNMVNKWDMEKGAFLGIIKDTPSELKNEMKSLFFEYLENKSYEARILHDLDLLERIIQARIYKENNPELNLKKFLEEESNIKTKKVREFVECVIW